jgi:hypothetical protein
MKQSLTAGVWERGWHVAQCIRVDIAGQGAKPDKPAAR